MGDITDGIMDGLFCESCGQYIDGDPPGYPRKCSGCRRTSKPIRTNTRSFVCPKPCNRGFKTQAALDQHKRDTTHGMKAAV